MVNYYRDMWRHRSHLLSPLSALCGSKATWKWGKEQQTAFEELKKVISKKTLLTFPDFEKEFHIYTDASDYQLGAVIMQENKPLAFYSRKFNKAQKRYTTGEQELLSIVETLKEFKNILFGQKLIVHTDHKNILYGNLSNDRITRWRLFLEEYAPTFVHVKGDDNVVADALSRMDTENDTLASGPEIAMCMAQLYRDESVEIPDPSNAHEMSHAFGADAREVEDEKFPMRPRLVSHEQQKDIVIKALLEKGLNEVTTETVEDATLVMFKGRIVVPKTLQKRIVAWYHEYLIHPGETRMIETMSKLYFWPKMAEAIKGHVKRCKQCQLRKKGRKAYGKLPPKEAEESVPWQRVNVDMMGPLTVKTAKGKKTLLVLTMIDPATGWFEVKDIPEQSSDACSKAFDDTWLCRYPRPQYIGYDNGKEYKRFFREMIANYGIKGKTTTTYNPQSNGIIERVHQTLANSLRTFELEEQELDAHDPWSPFLSAAAFAVRATCHTTMRASPGQLVFGRDMVLPIKYVTDWERLRQVRQKQINRDNARENRNRIAHTYKTGDKVLVDESRMTPKLDAPRTGPYLIKKIWSNGTITVEKDNISERMNIRRITPYFE